MNEMKPLLFVWIKNLAIGIFSLLFLVIGVNVLFSSYTLKNPFEFLLSFFASNLIILISAVGCLYAVLAIRRRLQQKNQTRP